MGRNKTVGSDLRGRVVVITGASSGLGREAAVQLARRGCRLVLAARREADLDETARLCRVAAAAARPSEDVAEALVVPTDVTREDDVKALVEAAVTTFGGIDVWVNNAGVTLFGLIEDGSFDDHRRVIETNLFGPMLAARAVVPLFRSQGRGTMINVGSVLSEVGQPFVPSYTISKFALRGLSEVLRAELADEPDIAVCTLLPYAFNTPHFQSGANLVGRRARVMPPEQSPEDVARALVSLVERPRRELHVPRAAVVGLAVRALFPVTAEKLLLHALRRWHFDEVPQPRTDGNLRRPTDLGEGEVHGRRPPQLGLARFAAWIVGDLVRIQIESIRRRLFGRRSVARAPRRLQPSGA